MSCDYEFTGCAPAPADPFAGSRWRDPEIHWSRGHRTIPAATHRILVTWIETGALGGDQFFAALLRNDLKGAVSAADDTNLAALVDIVAWFINYAPSGCWGGALALHDWRESGGLTGLLRPRDGGAK